MTIYKQDAITVNGVTTGEVLSGDEIRMPYRMAGSIMVDGVQYKFVGMDGGEAVYRLQAAPVATSVVPTKVAAPTYAVSDDTRTINRADLPSGAILSADFVGGRMRQGGCTYRMMQPVTKCEGLYVFVEAA